MKTSLTILVSALLAASCDGGREDRLRAEQYERDNPPMKIDKVRWNIVEVRSNSLMAQQFQGREGNVVAGGVAGLGAAALLGKTTPLGLAAGAALGAGVGAVLPQQTLANEKIACAVYATSPSGATFMRTYIGDNDAIRCSLAKPGDILVIVKEEERRSSEGGYYYYLKPVYSIDIEFAKK